MTGDWRLDWPILSISIFNTVLLIWLSLTVLLNAEKRDWGVWLVGGGLLSGALFFVSHTALIGIGVKLLGTASEFWWHLGWLPLIVCPLAWYLAVIWFSGFWDEAGTDLRKRQRLWLWASNSLAAALLVLILFSGLLPPLSLLALFQMGGQFSLAGFPLLPSAFSAYIFLTVGLSIDALYRPAQLADAAAAVAHRKARPWLTGVAFSLLMVSFLVGIFFIYWLSGRALEADDRPYLVVAWFDLVISGMISLAIVMVGQAIVAYELFSGRPLPRQGLRRGWRRVLLLALGYSALVGGSFALGFDAIYSLLLTAVIMTAFYALLNWRQTAERELLMRQLRPFVTSDRLYDRLLASGNPRPEAGSSFQQLCNDLLGCRTAFLVPSGPLAALVEPVGYPGNLVPPSADLLPPFTSPQELFRPLSPVEYQGATVAVPLWSARGPSGALLLAEKTDGGLYAQEEIEVARAFCERLLDVQAGAEISRRLMALQRTRMTHSQVADRRTRRALHDDILPQLHTAILELKEADGEARVKLSETHAALSDLLRGMPPATSPEFSRRGWLASLRRVVEEEFADAFDRTSWQVDPLAQTSADNASELVGEVLFYAAREAVRNAARHARRPGWALTLNLRVVGLEDRGLKIVIEDDGIGLDSKSAAHAGGLQLHATLLAIVGGSLVMESEAEQFTRVTLVVERSDWI